MSYNRKTWVDRNSQYPSRRVITNVNDPTDIKTVDVVRDEGNITTDGDVFDANTMNNLEGRIANEFTAVNSKIGDLQNLDTTEKSNIVGAINEVVAGGGGGGSSTLAGLTDTSISSPANGQVLKYNSTSSKWENANESGGGSSENYLVFVYTNSQGLLNHDLISSHYIYQGIVDQDGNTVAVEDVEGLIFTSGYSVYLDLTSTYSYTEHNRLKCECPYIYNGTKIYLGFAYLSELMKMLYTIQIETSSVSESQYDVEFWLTNAWTTDASSIRYSNTSSGLSATKVQGAIDELASEKADLASPAFTGNPTAPTQAAGNNTTRIATTAFVQGEKPSVGSITNLTTVSANSSGWQNVGSVNTAKGSKYLIVITAEFAGNSTGVRQIGISTTSGGAPMDFFRTVGANNMGTVKQQLQLVSILAPSSNTTYYINVAQNSGSGLEIKSKYSLIKLV